VEKFCLCWSGIKSCIAKPTKPIFARPPPFLRHPHSFSLPLSVFGCGKRGQIFFQLDLRNEKEWLLKVAFCVEKEVKHHKKAFIVTERILL
jgi:hypothetical protein